MTETDRYETARTAMSRIQALADGGFDVIIGPVRTPETKGFYVALEHLTLDEPEEFQAGGIAEALAAACIWVAARTTGESR